MNGCLHPPASVADAQAILEACGGSQWAQLAVLGLLSVVVVVLAFVLVLLALRQAAGR